MEVAQVRSVGRPRDDATGPALLDAARRLVIRDGYRAVSIQHIVDEAGVAKQTLYRRWRSKAELILDAFKESAGTAAVPETGPVEEILLSFLLDLFAHLEIDGPAIRNLIASAQEDPDFLASFRSRFVEPRAQIVTDILRAAQQRGEVPPDADLGTAVDAFHGAFWYRLLQADTLTPAFATKLTGFVLRGLGAF